MSLFRKDFKSRIKDSIDYFNSLDRSKQSYIISNLLELDEQDDEEMSALLFVIRNDISNYDRTTISNKLFELGLEETYSILFVKNIIEQAPTLQYNLKEISKIPDDEFEKKFPRCMNEIWVERKTHKELSQEQDIPISQMQAISNITRTFMNEVIRSNLSEKRITEICKSSDFSESQLKVMLNTIRINSEFWRKFVMFANTQDSFFSLQNIEQQNDLILRTMQEILKTLKGKDDPSKQNHFQ